MRIRLCVYMCVHTLTHELAKATARHEISMREAKGMWDGERSRMEDALKAERARSDEPAKKLPIPKRTNSRNSSGARSAPKALREEEAMARRELRADPGILD